MPTMFKTKHSNDLKLLLDTHVKTVKERMPKYGDAFEERVTKLQHQVGAYLEKQESIATSGRYSPDGERSERRLAARAFQEEKLAAIRADTVAKLETQLAEQRAAALKPKTATTDPLQAILKEMRQKELRDHLRTLDPLLLRARIKQAVDDGASTDLLEALEGAPAGFGIAPADLVEEARVKIAEKNHPELGELAQLRDAYTYAIGVVEQTVIAASGLTPLEIGADPTVAPRE